MVKLILFHLKQIVIPGYNATLPWVSVSFSKEDNFCDLLHASLDDEILLKRGLLVKGRNCSYMNQKREKMHLQRINKNADLQSFFFNEDSYVSLFIVILLTNLEFSSTYV